MTQRRETEVGLHSAPELKARWDPAYLF